LNNNKEIEKRKPVWNAIADFYLDTELRTSDYERIATEFIKSGKTIQQIKEIDFYEVSPVLKGNLMSVAGEWGGFNKNWLNENCEKKYLKRKKIFFRLKIKLSHVFWFWMGKGHWKEIEHLMKNAQQQKGA